jgi:hypothetical protein
MVFGYSAVSPFSCSDQFPLDHFNNQPESINWVPERMAEVLDERKKYVIFLFPWDRGYELISTKGVTCGSTGLRNGMEELRMHLR